MHRDFINSFRERRHQFHYDGAWRQCAGPGFCRECNREKMEDYVSEDTKKRIRAVLEEQFGPSTAEEIVDGEDLFTKTRMDADGVHDLREALDAEFKVSLPHSLFKPGITINETARYIDVMTAQASSH